MFGRIIVYAAAAMAVFSISCGASARDKWTKEKAREWHEVQPWLVGANYTPATAINQLEMWHEDTFDPQTIEREFTWAASIGMNTMRVFLHNLLWEHDRDGFKERIAVFLSIAEEHNIKVMFVLFDSVWDPNPQYGPQHPPIPGVHNSGWVQGPGAERLKDEDRYDLLEAYVKDVVGAFASDERVIAWDVWNEPNNSGGGNYTPTEDKNKYVRKLLARAYGWARSVDPIQPLTSAVWIGENWDDINALDDIERIQLRESDVNSFHDYNWPETFERRVNQMLSYGRPVLCTEYMARGNGSTFDGSLPIGKKYNIGMYNWGLVDGKTQARLPWDSWKKPYTYDEPRIWFHEIFQGDGTPYREAETNLIRQLSLLPKGKLKAD